MTVSYQYEVASSTSGGFTRLLFKWRGSLYKLIYRELLLFEGIFVVLSLLYRYALTTDQSRLFEQIVVYCDTFISLLPLSFILGFYVTYVAGRWWQQYMAIPWPDKCMHCIALYVNGNDIHARMVRRTLMRYLNLTLILVLRSISSAVKRRFPTLDHVVESGFMTGVELDMYCSVPSAEYNTYWIPCTWFISLLKESKRNSRITDSQGLKIIMEEFVEFRSKCGLLWSYDWVSIPLVYTQVVTIATYSFFLCALIGRQYVESVKKPFQMEIDKAIPIFTILQFFFFMGLLKVAEQLINPFGDDDEDFELNWLIDRHTKVSYLGVDTLMMHCPPLVKDMYFNESDLTLPYTEAAVPYKKKTYRGSVHNMEVPEEKYTMFLPEIIEEVTAKPLTPKNSVASLQQALAAGGLRGRRPSNASLTVDAGSVSTELEGPAAVPWKPSMSRSDSARSRRSIMRSALASPSSLSLAESPAEPTSAPQSRPGADSKPLAAAIKEKHGLDVKNDSDVDSVEGLRFNANSGVVSYANSANPNASRNNSTLNLVETRNKYLLPPAESVSQPVKKRRNVSWPKITVYKSKLPTSGSGKKKGVRWKTVLDEKQDKRKTIDVGEALAQILDADEDYILEQDEIARNLNCFTKDNSPTVYCKQCKIKIYRPLENASSKELDLSSGKLTTNLKKLLIYRPINYTFKTRSCPNLSLCTQLTTFKNSEPKNIEEIEPNAKCRSRRHFISSTNCICAGSDCASLPVMKFDIPDDNGLTKYDSNAFVPNTHPVEEVDVDDSVDKLNLSSVETVTPVPEIQEPDKENVDDISWESADWSTILSSRAPSLELVSSNVATSEGNDINDDPDSSDETLQEVVIMDGSEIR